MFVQLICKDRNEKEITELYQVISAICHREEVQIEESGDKVVVSVCPQGKIVIGEKDNELDLYASTRHAGAGFHAFVVDIFKDIQEELPGNYELIDDLHFAEDEDFDHLQALFEDELDYLRGLLLKEEEMRLRNYMYEETYYLPIEKENRICTSIGDMDQEEFRQISMEDLINSFYVWPNWDKDARYYKNAALTVLAKEGMGIYSKMNEMAEKKANEICDYIELAYQKDNQISLPVKEYTYLTNLLNRENKLTKDTVQMEQEVIQYRLKEVYHLFDIAKVVALGSAERCYDPVSQSINLMAPHKDNDEWEWLIQASLQPRIMTRLEEVKKQASQTYDSKSICTMDWEEDGYYVIEGILNQDTNTLYFHDVVANKEQIPYLKTCMKQSGFQNQE